MTDPLFMVLAVVAGLTLLSAFESKPLELSGPDITKVSGLTAWGVLDRVLGYVFAVYFGVVVYGVPKLVVAIGAWMLGEVMSERLTRHRLGAATRHADVAWWVPSWLANVFPRLDNFALIGLGMPLCVLHWVWHGVNYGGPEVPPVPMFAVYALVLCLVRIAVPQTTR